MSSGYSQLAMLNHFHVRKQHDYHIVKIFALCSKRSFAGGTDQVVRVWDIEQTIPVSPYIKSRSNLDNGQLTESKSCQHATLDGWSKEILLQLRFCIVTKRSRHIWAIMICWSSCVWPHAS